MAGERVADMTIAELKGIIAEVVNEQLSHWMSDLNANIKEKMVELTGINSDSGYYQLPHLTEAEQMQKNQELIEWYSKWAESGDEEEQRETLEYLQKALDEDRLSNRPLFAQQ